MRVWFLLDINECATGTHNCSVDAVCSNTKETFNCSCNPGYQGDGRKCTATMMRCDVLRESRMQLANAAAIKSWGVQQHL